MGSPFEMEFDLEALGEPISQKSTANKNTNKNRSAAETRHTTEPQFSKESFDIDILKSDDFAIESGPDDLKTNPLTDDELAENTGPVDTLLFQPIDDPEAPPLFISSQEPSAEPSNAAKAMAKDHNTTQTLATLQKLAGQKKMAGNTASIPGDIEQVLTQLSKDQAIDINQLPDAKILLVGILHYLMKQGAPIKEITKSILQFAPKD